MGVTCSIAVLAAALSWLPAAASAGPSSGGPPVGSPPLPASTGVKLVSSVFGSAGAPAQSRHYACVGTVSQSSPIGIPASKTRTLYSGFWGWWRGDPYFTPVPSVQPFTTRLFPNRPNPFNPATTIALEIGEGGFGRLTIPNVRGQTGRRLVAETRAAGRHSVRWDGRDDAGRPLASGLYFCRLEAPDQRATSKIAMIK
jgi:hypothetical protein